jgi:hypothetical protein
MCRKGFHFCENLLDVYNYYDKTSDTLIAEIEAIGEVLKEGDKSVTNKIKIVRLLTDKEKVDALLQKNNSGNYNSGNYNSGHRNSGHYNSGNYNSGHYNSGNYNSGYLNSDTPTMRLFNKDSGLSFDSPEGKKLQGLKGNLYSKVKPILQWVVEKDMTEEEKTNNPSYKTTGGFLRKTGKIDYSGWNNAEDLKFFMNLPNFDADIFYKITGIDVCKPKTIKVKHNDQEYEIDLEKAIELGIVKK